MPIDLFTDDLDAVGNDQRFVAIAEFAEAQPSEGWRHDYTEQWDDSSLKNVAAFANTFGGLLIVGVRKRKTDVVCELPGVESESEYTTRIASAIAANISPVPSYNVFECHKPDNPNRRFCVVRVRGSKSLHLLTKKGLSRFTFGMKTRHGLPTRRNCAGLSTAKEKCLWFLKKSTSGHTSCGMHC